MALFNCIECGNRVSDKAKMCPKCGCPIGSRSQEATAQSEHVLEMLKKLNNPEVQKLLKKGVELEKRIEKNKKIIAQVDEEIASLKKQLEKEIQIAGNTIRYSIDEYDYLMVHRRFEEFAWGYKKIFINYTQDAKRSYDLLYSDDLWQSFTTTLEKVIKEGKEYLLEEGIDFISQEGLKKRFLQEFDMDEYLRDYIDGKEQVIQFVEDLKYKRGVQRSTRSKWTGGGFGIKGALIGAAKASMLNLGTGAIRGIGDSLTNASDRSKVESLKSDILRQGKAYKSICETLYQGMCAIGDTVYSIFVQEGIANCCNTWWTNEHLEGKMDNTMQLYIEGRYNKEEAIKNLCECIQNYPMNIDPFLYIYQIEPSTRGQLLNVCELIGVDERFIDICGQLDRGWKMKWKV